MSGTDIALILGQVAVLVTALASALVSLRNSRKIEVVASTNAAVAENVRKIEVATNSMKDELVKEVREAALAKGEQIGKAAEKANPT